MYVRYNLLTADRNFEPISFKFDYKVENSETKKIIRSKVQMVFCDHDFGAASYPIFMGLFEHTNMPYPFLSRTQPKYSLKSSNIHIFQRP